MRSSCKQPPVTPCPLRDTHDAVLTSAAAYQSDDLTGYVRRAQNAGHVAAPPRITRPQWRRRAIEMTLHVAFLNHALASLLLQMFLIPYLT